jgi:hypothetical protein
MLAGHCLLLLSQVLRVCHEQRCQVLPCALSAAAGGPPMRSPLTRTVPIMPLVCQYVGLMSAHYLVLKLSVAAVAVSLG